MLRVCDPTLPVSLLARMFVFVWIVFVGVTAGLPGDVPWLPSGMGRARAIPRPDTAPILRIYWVFGGPASGGGGAGNNASALNNADAVSSTQRCCVGARSALGSQPWPRRPCRVPKNQAPPRAGILPPCWRAARTSAGGWRNARSSTARSWKASPRGSSSPTTKAGYCTPTRASNVSQDIRARSCSVALVTRRFHRRRNGR